MPKQLYNEGRITGMSAFESYIKKALETDPDNPPASETEWLLASLAMGSSMLVKIKASDTTKSGPQSIDIAFPTKCRLCAANNVVAQLFSGKGYYGGNATERWASKVTEYSPLISNDATASPNGVVTTGSGIPKKADAHFDDTKRGQLVDYMKILDGVILQPGTWSNNASKPPQKEFAPDLSKPPILRILFSDRLENDIEIMMVGFTNRVVVQGETGVDTSVNTASPESGDFLGPACFPWSSKIEFTVPTSAMTYFMLEKYKRKIPRSGSEIKVDDSAVIDMRTTNPGTYYTASAHQGSRVEMNVSDFTTTGEGDAVLTTYQKPSKTNPSKYQYPPALWGTYVTSKGDNYLHPLDVVAPGTVKMFPHISDAEDQAQLNDYQNTFPESWGLIHNPDGTVSGLDDDGKIQKVADMSIQDLTYTSPSGSSSKAKGVVVQTGKKKGFMLAMGPSVTSDGSVSKYTIGSEKSVTNKVGNTSYIDGDNSQQKKIFPETSDINWSMLLAALANNQAIDILNKDMKVLKAGLSKTTPYIQFNNGLRLYISTTQPKDTDVPVGSIGIGW